MIRVRLLGYCLLLLIIIPAILPAADGYWIKRTDMPTARQEILPAALDGKIYVVGGWPNSSSISDLVEVYDPATDSWSTVAPYPYPIHHCGLAGIDGLLYVIGGYYNISWPWSNTREIWSYDPAIDEWSFVNFLNVGRGEHNVSVYNGKVYVIGGKTTGGVETAVVEVFDPATGTCTILDSLPTVRHHLATAVVDSLIYAVGGRVGEWGGPYTNIDIIEAYSPASDIWYTVTNMPNPRGGLSAIGVTGKLYTFGGEIPGLFPIVEEYDPSADSWREMTSMLTPRHGTAATMVGDTIYIIGGSQTEGMSWVATNEGFLLGTCIDTDHDGYGDSDDPSFDCLCPDNCPDVYNPKQIDTDNDGVGDICDGCPEAYNPNQVDTDADGVQDSCDNCPDVYNPEQTDENENGVGDICDWVCGDGNGNGTVNILDVTFLIAFLYKNGPEPEPLQAGDVNSSGNVNILDVTYLIAFLYKDGPDPLCS